MKIIAWPRKLQLRGHRRSYGTLQAAVASRSCWTRPVSSGAWRVTARSATRSGPASPSGLWWRTDSVMPGVTPREPWVPESHPLFVDPVLEDLAGNSVSRVFDRDLATSADEPVQAQTVTVS